MSNVSIAAYDNSLHREQVISLWKTVFDYDAPHNKPELAIDRKLECGGELFFVAAKGAEVIGTIMAGYDGHRGWIYLVCVAPEHRRLGVGSRLVKHAEDAMTELGCVKINLQILETNSLIESFYASLGYNTEKRISMGKRIPGNVPTV